MEKKSMFSKSYDLPVESFHEDTGPIGDIEHEIRCRHCGIQVNRDKIHEHAAQHWSALESVKAPVKEFTASPNYWTGIIWGSGHTHETSPPANGWKVRRYNAHCIGDTILAGRPGIKGCFTARPLNNGSLDVGIYRDLTPEEVQDNPKEAAANCFYEYMENVSGWGLRAIELLEP